MASAADLYPKPPFAPPAGHPRVYFTAKDIPRILQNTQKPQNAAAWSQHLKNLKSATTGKLPAPPRKGAENNSSVVLGVIESLAFDYAIRGDKANGQKAISAMRNYIDSVIYPAKDYNNTGQTVFTIGVVYDWCFNLLSPEDKEFFYNAVIKTAEKMEIGWPPVKQGAVTGHGPEAQLQRDIMSAAVAMYDEKPELYNIAAGRFFAEFIEPKKFMYPAHMHHQGSHYMSYRHQWEMLGMLMFDRMGLPEVYGPDQKYTMSWSMYARRPDGQILRDGDTHINNKPLYSFYTEPSRATFLSANQYGNPYLKMDAMRQRPFMIPSTPSGNQALGCVEMLIFNDPDLEGRPLHELPNTKYFPSPKGAMIARTGWDDGLDSPVMLVEMKINEWYFANHQHLDAGAFQIYYKGALATDSGYYQSAIDKTDTPLNEGSTGYGSLYDVNYDKRSIAHNTISVYDPNEKFLTKRWAKFPMANDGGQRFPNLGIEVTKHEEVIDPANGNKIGTILGHEFGKDALRPDYSYLKGDLSKAYSEKIKGYERSFMFLDLKNSKHPGALVVFDRVVSADKNFRKSWILHGLEEPTIKNNQTIYRDTRPGYNGKLVVDTVLPKADNTVITKIGGPGKENWVDGVNYKATLLPNLINEGGGWRIEVSPKQAAEADYFLNVLQVGDSKPDTTPLPVYAIDGKTHSGVRIADRVVLFGKNRDRTRDSVSIEFAAPGKYQISVADLTAGRWKIEYNGEAAGSVTVGEEGGLAVWKGQAGKYRLSYAGAARAKAVKTTKPKELAPLDITGVRVEEKLIYSVVKPHMKDGTILLPLRVVAEKMGYQAALSANGKELTISKGDKALKLKAGSRTAQLGDKTIDLVIAPQAGQGDLLAPAAVLQSAFDTLVIYDPFARIVNVYATPEPRENGGIPIRSVEVSSYYQDTIGPRSFDGRLDTWWSASGYDGEWIKFDLGQSTAVKDIEIAWNKGHQRQAFFSIEISNDGDNWTMLVDGKSSGKTAEYESVGLQKPVQARYIRVNGKGNSASAWNAIAEIRFLPQ